MNLILAAIIISFLAGMAFTGLWHVLTMLRLKEHWKFQLRRTEIDARRQGYQAGHSAAVQGLTTAKEFWSGKSL